MTKSAVNNSRTLRCPIPGDPAGVGGWDTGDPARGFNDTTAPNTYSGLELETIPVDTTVQFMWSIAGPVLDRMALYAVKFIPVDSSVKVTQKMLFEIRHGVSGVVKTCVRGFINPGQPLDPNLLVQVSGRLASYWEFWCCVDGSVPGAVPVKMTMRALFDRAGCTVQPNVIASVDTSLVTVTFAE